MSKEVEQILRTANELQAKLDSLMKLQQNAIDQLPEEERAKLSFFQRDVIQMKNAMKKGDLSKIQTFMNRYADNSTKY